MPLDNSNPDEYFEQVKSSRGFGRGGGGGGTPVPGPGPAPGNFPDLPTFAGGISFGHGYGDTRGLPVIIRKRGMPKVPGVTPGAPGRSDTVPAMLTPGEIVMNRGVTDNPQLSKQLLELNQQGAKNMMTGRGPLGMEHGGEVPGYFLGGLAVGAAKKAFGKMSGKKGLKGAMQGAGDYLKGQFSPGGPMGGGANAMSRFGGLGNMGNFGGGFGQQGGPQAPMFPIGGGGMMPGYEHGGMVDGEDDNGEDSPDTRHSKAIRLLNLLLELDEQDDEPVQGFFFGGRAKKKKTIIDPYGYEKQQVGDIAAARQAGYFDPRGNQMMMRGMNEAAQGTADALVRRQMTQANLGGMDPAQRAVAKQQALMQTGRGVQDIMAQTRATGLQNQNQFFQNMYGQAAGAGMQARFQNDLAKRANERSGGFMGQLAGQAIGGFMGGMGG